MLFAPIQLLSILATVAVYVLSGSSTTWFSLVFALGFVHYLLGLVYARRQLGSVLSQGRSAAPLLLVLGGGAWLYLNDVPLYLYFAVHHAFNEVYVRSALHADADSAVVRRTAGVMFHFSAYVLILTAQRLSPFELTVVLGVVLASFAVYMAGLARVRRDLGTARIIDLCTIEIVMLAMVPVAFLYQFSFEQVVFYHFVFWGLYPLGRMLQRGDGRAGIRYVAMTAAALAVFVFLSPIGPSAYNAPVRLYYEQFLLWSYLHITLSFALSSAHPRWITTWFAPRTAAA